MLHTLPTELKRKILNYLSPIDACAVRLVCKALLPDGTERAFSLVVIRNEHSNRRAKHILHSGLRNHVQHVIYRSDKSSPDGDSDAPPRKPQRPTVFAPPPPTTPDNPDDHDYDSDDHDYDSADLASDEENDALEMERGHERGVADLLNHLGTLPRLERFALVFHGQSAGAAYESRVAAGWWDRKPGYQTAAQRHGILKAVFRALAPARSLRHLELYYYLDGDNAHLIRKEMFRRVLARLESLEMYFIGENDGDDELGGARRRGSLQLFSNWLPHTRKNLRRLVVAGDDYWGYLPCSRVLRKLYFPRLRELEFGGWSLSQPWEVDWLLRHAATLRSLSLLGASVVMETEDGFRHPFDDRLDPDDWQNPRGMTWASVFRRLRTGLPGLVRFYFCGIGSAGFDYTRGKHEVTVADLARACVLARHGGARCEQQVLAGASRPEAERFTRKSQLYDSFLAEPDEDTPVFLYLSIVHSGGHCVLATGAFAEGTALYDVHTPAQAREGTSSSFPILDVEEDGFELLVLSAVVHARRRGKTIKIPDNDTLEDESGRAEEEAADLNTKKDNKNTTGEGTVPENDDKEGPDDGNAGEVVTENNKENTDAGNRGKKRKAEEDIEEGTAGKKART